MSSKLLRRTTADTYVEFGARTGYALVAKGGTLYAKYDGSAVVTVAGVDYTVNFVF